MTHIQIFLKPTRSKKAEVDFGGAYIITNTQFIVFVYVLLFCRFQFLRQPINLFFC